jgi:hypothetical protein
MKYASALFGALLLHSFYSLGADTLNLKGTELLTSKPVQISTQFSDKKGLVVVFLSAKCPCSNSHVKVLNELSKKYPKFRFVAFHSNSDETIREAQDYFQKNPLNFQVLKDKNSKTADALKAYKTPHAFILNQKGEIVYKGGVTDSSTAERASRNYLEEALADINQDIPIRLAEGRTLGCVIMRPEDLKK